MEIKAKYSLLEPKCGAWRQNGGRPYDVTGAGRPVLRGLEVILQILRLGGHFCGDHGASEPPPWLEVFLLNKIRYIYTIIMLQANNVQLFIVYIYVIANRWRIASAVLSINQT